MEMQDITQSLGEVLAKMENLNSRLDRIETRLEKMESIDVLSNRISILEQEQKDLKGEVRVLQALPSKILWAVGAALAAGIGGIVLDIVK
jgi:chromosome segregation ATPase